MVLGFWKQVILLNEWEWFDVLWYLTEYKNVWTPLCRLPDFFQKSARIKFNNPLLYFILKQYSLGSMLIRE